MSSKSTPDVVYRLATAAEWAAALDSGALPKREIDERDGYFHLSTREQVLETANLHFAGTTDLLALEIPLAPIAELVKFELAPKRGEAFPHLYGVLNRDYVTAAIRLLSQQGSFAFGEHL